jgi:pimeloyl-ACP methyl ester carboxylesterase
MLTTSFPRVMEGLTESASIALASKIQCISVQTSLCAEAIATTYVHQGEGQGQGQPPILLLHGFDSSVLEFRRLLPLLAAQTQAWAVDLLGFGFTERPDNLEISTLAIRQHLYHFWETTIQQPVILVGASMGGAAAIDFALTFPEIVNKLVLIDSAGYRSGPALGKALIHPLGHWATEKFLRKPSVRQKISEKAYFDPRFASLDAQQCAALHLDCPNWSKALISFTRSGGYRSVRSHLSQLRPLTLILWGAADRILGTKDAECFRKAIPQSKLIWIPDCGHVPHLEKPDAIASAILEFGLD